MADSSAIISAAQLQTEINVNVYFAIISLTILLYDYGLTVRDEIRGYWGTRTTWPSVLFYINRYGSMVGNSVPIIMGNLWTTRNFDPHKVQACRKVQTYHQYFSILAQIFVAGLLIMRTYALYERSRRVLILTTGIAVAAVAVGAYILTSAKSSSVDFSSVYVDVGCASGLDKIESRRLGFGWIGMLVFDIAIFSLTAWKALAHSREERGRGGLFTILIRDGSIFFFVIVASNGGNILSFFYAGPYTRGVATTFTNVISSVMVSRLMLNLRTHSLRDGSLMRTGESTTLYNPPISTVVDPYYPSTRFAESRLDDDGRFGDHEDIQLEDLSDVRRQR